MRAHSSRIRGPPRRGNSRPMQLDTAFSTVLSSNGPNFSRMKSGRLPMSTSSCGALFFSLAGLAHAQQFAQMIGQVAVGLALVQQFQIFAHQGRATSQEEGDLSDLSGAFGGVRR